MSGLLILRSTARNRVLVRELRDLFGALAHAVNHAQAVVLPLIFLRIIDEFGVSVQSVTFVAAAGAIASGVIQASYAFVTRHVARRWLLARRRVAVRPRLRRPGGRVVVPCLRRHERRVPRWRLAAAPGRQRVAGGAVPAGAARLRDQRPYLRRQRGDGHRRAGRPATARAVRLAWGLDPVRHPGRAHRAGDPALGPRERRRPPAAIREGTVREAVGTILRDPDDRRTYLASVLGGGGRGLGVANLFALLYLTHVLGLPEETTNLMYARSSCCPSRCPSSRAGCRIGSGAGRSSSAPTSAARSGSSCSSRRLEPARPVDRHRDHGPVLLRREPAAPGAARGHRPDGRPDVAFALYFTLAFGVGSLWTALYGAIIGAVGEAARAADRASA